MGFRSFGSLLIIFCIIALLFGTKRLREMGGDIGAAVKNFRKNLQEDVEKKSEET